MWLERAEGGSVKIIGKLTDTQVKAFKAAGLQINYIGGRKK